MMPAYLKHTVLTLKIPHLPFGYPVSHSSLLGFPRTPFPRSSFSVFVAKRVCWVPPGGGRGGGRRTLWNVRDCACVHSFARTQANIVLQHILGDLSAYASQLITRALGTQATRQHTW